MGNPVNSSATQRELSVDMGSRLDPEHGASMEGKPRKLLFLARSRPHLRTSWNQERRWVNYGPPQRAQGGITRQSPSRQLGHAQGVGVGSLASAPSYVVTHPETTTETPPKVLQIWMQGRGAGPSGCSTYSCHI